MPLRNTKRQSLHYLKPSGVNTTNYKEKNSTTGADASGNISYLAHISCSDNWTHSELSQCNSQAVMQTQNMLISWAWLQYQYASEIAVGFAIAFGAISLDPAATLSCSTDRIYKLPGSQVWVVLSSVKSRSPATAIKVSKSRHNSWMKL